MSDTLSEPDSPAPVTPAPASAPAPVAPAPRSHRTRRWLVAGTLALLLLVVLAATAAAAGAAAWDHSYAGRILPGVTAGGVDLSGMTRDQAIAAIEAAYPVDRGTVVLQPAGGAAIQIPYAAASRRVDAAAVADAAMASGRGGDLAQRLPAEIRLALSGASLDAPALSLDEQALAVAIRRALAPLAADAVDATVTMTKDGPVTTPAATGTSVDPEPAVATAVAALRRLDAPSSVIVPVEPAPVAPAISDTAVASAVAQADLLVDDLKLQFKKKTWTIKASQIRSWIRFATADGTVRPEIDPSAIAKTKAFAKAKKAVHEKPTSAVFLKTKSGRIFGVAPGAYGRKLDIAATQAKVVAELTARLAGAKPAAVKVALADLEPKVTTEEAGKKAPVMQKLGSWTTWFPISERNYFGANIWQPARYISGTVLAPGQTFDWFRAIGPVTSARGFGAGGVIRATRTDPTGAMGGGMCSSSTTLFNAALRAGLRMGARDNHKYYINRYPLGLDATVWKIGGATQSMSFTNDTRYPILIRGIRTRSGGRGFVTYEIWGKSDGRTVSISRPHVSNVVRATTRVETTTTLPKGHREQVEYPSNQMDVSVTRVVRSAKGAILHSEVWRTHYILWNGLIQVGV